MSATTCPKCGNTEFIASGYRNTRMQFIVNPNTGEIVKDHLGFQEHDEITPDDGFQCAACETEFSDDEIDYSNLPLEGQ